MTSQLLLLALPGIVYYLIFHYLPMGGLVLAFKNYRYDLGIFASPWCGFDNFKFFFATNMWWRVTRNTVCYAAVTLALNVLAGVLVAMLLLEVRGHRKIKVYQTAMYLPNFMSWVLVSFIVYLFLNHEFGLLNQILTALGFDPVRWYNEVKAWPFILVIVNLWKSIGMNTLIYYAALLGIDQAEYEAASLDGASKWQQMRYISLPHLIPLISIMTIMGVGNFFRGDFGLFYNVTRNMSTLYPVTDVIDTYVYRGLMELGNIGMTTAVGFAQSFIGLVLVLISNYFVRKINPDNSLF